MHPAGHNRSQRHLNPHAALLQASAADVLALRGDIATSCEADALHGVAPERVVREVLREAKAREHEADCLVRSLLRIRLLVAKEVGYAVALMAANRFNGGYLGGADVFGLLKPSFVVSADLFSHLLCYRSAEFHLTAAPPRPIREMLSQTPHGSAKLVGAKLADVLLTAGARN
ncbi:hypothetical protein CLOM_g8344 [Closterium sp. NIES-68]|nr:hypothetical protein CLOM_g8344 [Closterium sp. NIES-68]